MPSFNSRVLRITMVVAIVLIGVVSRLLPHIPNLVPITAIALFAGAYLPYKYGWAVPVVLMIGSDLILGLHNVVLFTWGSYLLIALLGRFFLKGRGFGGCTIIGSIAAAVLFFVVTNFGVWLMSGMYPHTLVGLMNSYVMAIPFFRNSLIGDVFYTVVLIGGFEFVSAKVLQIKEVAV